MNKFCTTVEQSKKLIDLGIDVNTADMFYADLLIDNKHKYIVHPLESYGFKTFKDTNKHISQRLNFIPCWSLTTLLNFLPNTLYWFDNAWHCEYVDEDGVGILGTNADNALDACYEMIIKLYEQKLL